MTDPEKSAQSGEPPSRGEKVFVAVALLLSTGAFQNLWLDIRSAPTEEENLLGTFITGLIYLVTLFLLIRHCRSFIRLFLREWPLTTVIGFTIISALWSEAPEISARHGITLLFTFVFGLYLAVRYRLQDQIRLLVWVVGLCVIFSFIFGALGLGASVDEGEGVAGWYGVFTQKNTLGTLMALSTLVFLLWRRIEPKHKGIASIGLMGSLVLVALSQSMTSMIAIALLLVVIPYVQWTVRKGVRRFAAGLMLLTAAGMFAFVYVANHLPEVTTLLGKNVTLTGRLPLWVVSCAMALQRPWLGYGYDAFWMQDEGAVRIQRAVGWAAPHSHNGFLEIWLGLGLCGLGLFICGFAFYIWRSLKFLMRRPGPEAIWPFLFLTFLFLTNLTQVTLLYRNSLFMVLYAAAGVSSAPDSTEMCNPLTLSMSVADSAASA